MSAPTRGSLASALRKMQSPDKDYRYMACSDLLGEISRESFGTFPSSEQEREAMVAVTRCVFDASADVAGLAMKCCASIAKRAAGETCEELCEELCKALSGKDGGRRDAASMCLKTIVMDIGTFDEESRTAMLGACAPALAALVEKGGRDGATGEEANVAAEAVDVVHAIATALSTAPHVRLTQETSDELQRTLLGHIERGKTGTRKRAAQCVALLSTYAKDDALDRTVETVSTSLEESIASKGKSDLYAFTLGAVARAVGYRFGEHAERVTLILLRVCKSATDDYDEEAIVNIESALRAIESIVSSCSSSTQGSEGTAARIAVALKYVSHDPNFDDDEAMDTDGHDATGDDDDEDEYSEDDDYDEDDDDESWKVRRAAAKVLSSVMSTAPESTLTEHYDDVMSKLLSRSRDREPSVQLDIFSVIGDVIHVTRRCLEHNPDSKLGAKLRASATDVVRVIVRESTSKNQKTQIAAYTLLRSLGDVFPGLLAEVRDTEARDSVVRAVERCISDQAYGTAARIEALAFICSICKPEGFDALEPYVHGLLPHIYTACADKYYKIVAESLRSCAALVFVLRREDAGMVPADNVTEIKSLLDAVLSKLDSSDEDQDVKEAAIHVCAVILAKLNDLITTQDQSRVLGLLLERSRNETTRLAAVRAFAMIAGSSSAVDLSAVAASVTGEFTTFLRKSNKALRESSLAALTALVSCHSAALQDPDVLPVVTESSSLLNEEDLHLATMSAGLLSAIAAAASSFPKAALSMATTTLPLALALTRSPLVQRQTLKSLQELYKSLVLADVVTFKPLLDALSDTSGIQSVDSQFVAHSLAKCVASACVASGEAVTKETTDTLLAKLKDAKGIDAVYTLLCIGEIGRLTDVSLNKELETILFSAFDSYGDDVKGAAALTLGRVAVGNREKYLPLITSKLANENIEHQYSLLQALREVIVVGNLNEQEANEVMAILDRTASSEEEGVRNVVSECLGRLTASNPKVLMPEIANRFAASASALEKATHISAVKFAVLASAKGELTKIRGDLRLPEFMSAISDEDVNVRTAVIKMISAVIHRESALIVPILPDILPKLLAQTAIVTELVKVYDLGAFKHTVDDGFECRKSAFECVNTILDSCAGLVNARDVVSAITSGLGDHYDIKMLAHATMLKLSEGIASNSTDAVLANLDSFCAPLEKTLTARVKSDAVQQEIDRNNDLLRSVLRTVRSINRHASSTNVASWKKFNEDIVVGKENIAEMYSQLENDE
ncbi:putative TIP120 protein [Ostreococcus tauri]|uniref:Putative TIP120 protein n=1 Tax=Ostreococcus tauri TaxID=70448 RepID=A0A1Y5I9K4_OSTTA|nr:putative TIP120 protein [Ostreococcus tauri]